MKEREENKSGAVFINYINYIITNIKFKICTYCKYVNISCGSKEMTFINRLLICFILYILKVNIKTYYINL
jgi:hypothetical protein